MFREMRRRKQALSIDDCKRVLTQEKRGVLAVIGDEGYPYAIPMNFLYDPDENAIYLHSAIAGHKIDAIKANDKVCFTVWNQGERLAGDWSFFVDSVIAFGHASIVEDGNERIAKARELGGKYYPSSEEVEHEIEKAIDRMALIRVKIEHLTGKHVHER